MATRLLAKTLELAKTLNPNNVAARSLKLLLSRAAGGGRRSFSEVATNFPFARAGEGAQNRCYAGTDSSVISSSGRTFNKGQCGNMHPAVVSSKQTLASSRNTTGVIENVKPSLPVSVSDGDDFAELGPSIQLSANLGSDLVKENCKDTKPPAMSLDNEPHQARRTCMQQFLGRKFQVRLPMEQDIRHSDNNFNPANQNDVARAKSEPEKQKYVVENNKTRGTISIDKVPPSISLLDLRDAVSAYGEILSASLETAPNRLTSCHVEFKSIESKERVLAAQRITVGDCQLPVRDLYIPDPEYITVRICNMSMETAETAVHSMCMACGAVAGLGRTKEGAVDVVFRVKSNLEAQTILRRLNDVYYDDCQWSAQIVPILGQISRTDTSGSRWSVGSEINNLMETFRKQFQMQRIYLEDLENLHYAILHLRDRPADMIPQVRDG